MPPIVREVVASPGRQIDPVARAFFEPRFGLDFSHVRIHTNARAAASAHAVDALAYTVGRDIVFGRETYAPATPKGASLLAHELAHVTQHAPAPHSDLMVQRQPIGSTEDLHEPLVEAYRQANGLPPKGVDPATGAQVGPTDGEIVHGADYERWLRQGNVPAPSAPPTLAPVSGPLDPTTCGVVRGGMDPTAATKIRGCITHARYVNIMNQSIANIRQVASPYALGLAALYDALLKQVVSAKLSNPPMSGSPQSFTISNVTVAISSSTTFPVPSFTLELIQSGTQSSNGSYNAVSGILTLNEESPSAVTNNQPDVERTMYHEGFHFFSALVTFANQKARAAAPPGRAVNRELDAQLTGGYRDRFLAAVAPIWASALKTVTVSPSTIFTAAPSTRQLGLAQWIKVENEILSRVEEAVYLASRVGKGFSKSDLTSLPQPWLYQVDYWDGLKHFDQGAMQTYLATNRGTIDGAVLPPVREIQSAYLYLRPVA